MCAYHLNMGDTRDTGAIEFKAIPGCTVSSRTASATGHPASKPKCKRKEELKMKDSVGQRGLKGLAAPCWPLSGLPRSSSWYAVSSHYTPDRRKGSKLPQTELLQGISPRLPAPDYELAVHRNQSNRPQAQKTSCPKPSSLPFSNLPCLLGDKTLLSDEALPTLRKRKPKESGQASARVPPAQSVSITSCLSHHTSTLGPRFRHIPAAKPTRSPEKD